MKIERLAPNLVGRDFVCGDIHGSYSCVTKFLKEIKFVKSRDRLICAGDLVDRGPNNEACLDLLNQKWFHCVKGNHEQLMEEYFKGNYYGMYWSPNGGDWGTKYLNDYSTMGDFVRKMLKKIEKLPYLITVETRTGNIFHVLHAELPQGKPITDADLADQEKFTQLATIQTQDGDHICWGRYIFRALYDQHLDEHKVDKFRRGAEMQKLGSIFNPNLSPIYSGHTIVRRPVQFTGQTDLDTMAYGSYSSSTRYGPSEPPEWCGLTVTEPLTGKFWLVNDRTFKEVLPVVI